MGNSAQTSLIGERIEAIKEHHDDDWVMLKMESGRVIKFWSNSYYGGESDISYDEVDIEEWENPSD